MASELELSPSLAMADSDHVEVQKKTFGKWLNTLLEEDKVTDLFYDLRDGILLLAVLEKLTGRKLRREKGSLRLVNLLLFIFIDLEI